MNMSKAAILSRRKLIASAAALICTKDAAFALQAGSHALLAHNIASNHRSAANRARDVFRKPFETIAFLGVEPHHKVVEILPGGGAYWLEFLAPYLREHGLYVAASRDSGAAPNYVADHKRLLAKLAADPARYDRVQVTEFLADKFEIAPEGSMDFVLTFRNMHNWIDRGEIDGALRAFRKALKPGGILGVADHRGRTDRSQEEQKRSGYMRQDFTIELLEKGGFKLLAASEVKANPKDTKDHADGVWSLPPNYRSGDKDRAKYEAIGESDRFLLKFARV
jgi:predicted methyltransferase